MKLINIFLFSLATLFFVIGVHQMMLLGEREEFSFFDNLAANYWIFMLSIGCLFAYTYLKNKQKEKEK